MKKLFPDEQILDTTIVDVHQDWEIPIPGFFIVAAKRKIRSVMDFTDAEVAEFGVVIKKVRQGMAEVLGITDVYMFQREDTEWDFHLWLLPRYNWMDQFGRKVESVRPIINHAIANMTDKETLQQVSQAAEKMRVYLKDFKV